MFISRSTIKQSFLLETTETSFLSNGVTQNDGRKANWGGKKKKVKHLLKGEHYSNSGNDKTALQGASSRAAAQ